MGLFSRKAWEPEPINYHQVYEYLDFEGGTQFNSDPWVARLWMPITKFGHDRYWYRGVIVNKGDHAIVKVEGKKLGELATGCLAEAVKLFKLYKTNEVRVAVSGRREGNKTQSILGNLKPVNGSTATA